MPIDKQKVLAGRHRVDVYRTAHTALHSQGWHKGIPEEHTPLLNIMLGAFKGLGFSSVDEFFVASELFNIQELGFKNIEDFKAKATETDIQKLMEMWH